MKISDFIAVGFILLYACAVFFFPLNISPDGSLVWGSLSDGFSNFGHVTKAHPYLMGFFKVGLLATFGEMLKVRRKTGSWKVPALPARFIVWGITGMVFSYVFAMFATGVGALMGSPVWPVGSIDRAAWSATLIFAVSTSFWQNMIFAYPVMLGHEWCNEVINKKRFVGGEEFLASVDKHIWGSFIPKTILYFWIPAHTVTFCLPQDYRVLMSAVLSLALGFILTFRPKAAKK